MLRSFLPWLMVASVGCVPRLYSEGGAGGPWSWEAPENRWGVDEPPEGLLGTGWSTGQVAPDFRLIDQHGEEVALWQFYGRVVLVDISTMWCAPCRDLAAHTEETWQDYDDEGFVYLTVLQEDVEGEPVTPEDQVVWADAYGITSPVLGDPDKAGTGAAILQGQYPAVLVIDRDLVVVERVNPPDDASVRAAIEDAL